MTSRSSALQRVGAGRQHPPGLDAAFPALFDLAHKSVQGLRRIKPRQADDSKSMGRHMEAEMTGARAPELQREVQRLMGRCMLRIQQYEKLLKAILASHEVAGPMDQLDTRREAQARKFSGKTLGQLAGVLFDSYVVCEGKESEFSAEEELPIDVPSVAIRLSIQMPEERWRETKAAIAELVSLRNELVHHLIERFDVWVEDGCLAASAHLLSSFERINKHYEELSEWARLMCEGQARLSEQLTHAVLSDLIIDGIRPDGSFEWPETGIVRALREASATLAVAGWTQLKTARIWLAEHRPDQLPEKYGCRTWPQVLNESKCFRLEYRAGKDGGREAWFQPRA